MGKIKEQLAGIAALIGVLGAIGAGFVKYGEMQEQLNNVSGIDMAPLQKQISEQNVERVVAIELKAILKLFSIFPLFICDASTLYFNSLKPNSFVVNSLSISKDVP